MRFYIMKLFKCAFLAGLLNFPQVSYQNPLPLQVNLPAPQVFLSKKVKEKLAEVDIFWVKTLKQI